MVLIPRPEGKTQSLARVLQKRGWPCWQAPVLQIVCANPVYNVPKKALAIAQYDWVIFTSSYAVQCAEFCPWSQWPNHVGIATVGTKTAGAVKRRLNEHREPDWVAEGSHGLLSAEPWQAPMGQEIAIVGGKGGRQLLQKRLRERGARVIKIPCYQRQTTNADLFGGANQSVTQVRWVLGTSVDCLRSLKAKLTDWQWKIIRRQTLITMSQRIAKQAKSLGYTGSSVVSLETSELGLIQALEACWKGNYHERQN